MEFPRLRHPTNARDCYYERIRRLRQIQAILIENLRLQVTEMQGAIDMFLRCAAKLLVFEL